MRACGGRGRSGAGSWQSLVMAVVLTMAFALTGVGALPAAAWAQTTDGLVGINLDAPSTVQQGGGSGEGSQGLVGVNVTVQQPAEEPTPGEGPALGSNGASGLVGVNVTIPETAKQDPAAGEGSLGLVGVNVTVQQPAESTDPDNPTPGDPGKPGSSGAADGLVGVNLDVPSTALHDPTDGTGSEGLVGVNLWTQTGLYVTFDPNGGTMPTTLVSANYDKPIDMPSVTPDWPGRTFGKMLDGTLHYWFRDAACTQPWYFDTDTVKDTITLYAGWTWIEPHAVGDVVLHMVYGNTVIDNAESYGVSGYAPNYDSGQFGDAPEGDASDEFVYEGDYYLGGGEPMDATLALPDARMIKSDKLSGSFIGWFDERGNKVVKVDRFSYGAGAPGYTQEFWAKWDATPTHTVTFDAGENAWFDEAGSPRYKHVEVPDRKTVARPADPVHAEDAAAAPGGWKFGGWYYDEACTQPYQFGSKVGASFTLHAKWEAIPQHTVTFDANGGVFAGAGDGGVDVGTLTQLVVRGGTVTRPDVDPVRASVTNGGVRTDYTFVGWYADATLATPWNFALGVVQADLTLYAKWKATETAVGGDAEEWRVTFDAGDGLILGWGDDGGDVARWTTVVTSDDPYVDAAAVPGVLDVKRVGYVFGGWYREVAGDGDAGDGGGAGGSGVPGGAGAGGTGAPDWSAGSKWDASMAVTGDMTLHAKWDVRLDVTVPVSIGFVVNAETGEVATPEAARYSLKSRTVEDVQVSALTAVSVEDEVKTFFALPEGKTDWAAALARTSLSVATDDAGSNEVALPIAGTYGPVKAEGVETLGWTSPVSLMGDDVSDEMRAAYAIAAFSYGTAGTVFDETWEGGDPSERLPLKLGMTVPIKEGAIALNANLDGPQTITHLRVTVTTTT